MIARSAGVAALVLAAGAASAAVNWRDDVLKCTETHKGDAAKIGECVSALAEKKLGEESAESAKVPVTPIPEFSFRMRDSSTAAIDYTIFDFGTKGATWSLERENGQDTHVAKAGVFGYFRPLDRDGRIQPFVGASVVKSGTGDSKKDIRDVTVGTVGTIWQKPKEGDMTNSVSLVHTLQLTRRDDKYGAGEGNIARLHGDIVWLSLASGELLGVGVVPHVGYLWQKRTGGGPEDGRWNSSYFGLAAGKTIGRFQATLLARRLFDHHVPSGNTKRRDSYASLSLDYFFYDPKDKKAAFQPSIFITRDVGSDHLTGVGKDNKTTAGIRVKFN